MDIASADFETLGHACSGPGAQMRAAAATRGLRVFLGEQREALDRVTALADALHEKIVVWDVATRGGRRAARRKGVHGTPMVLVGPGPAESVNDFLRAAIASPRTPQPARG